MFLECINTVLKIWESDAPYAIETEHFGRISTEKAQMTEIAAAAELSRASLYAMFTGKEELYQEVIRTTAESIRAVVEERMETFDDPRDRLLCVIDSLFSCYEENQDLLQIYTRATNGLPWRIRQAMGEEPVNIFWDFVERGGTLMVMGEHTVHEQDEECVRPHFVHRRRLLRPLCPCGRYRAGFSRRVLHGLYALST